MTASPRAESSPTLHETPPAARHDASTGTAPARADTVASVDTAPPASPPPPGSDSASDAVPPLEPATAATPERSPAPPSRLTPLKQLLLTLLLVVIAADSVGRCRLLPVRGDDKTAPPTAVQGPVIHTLAALVPAPVWQNCKKAQTPRAGALETATCLPPQGATTFTPDRLELSTFASGAAVQRAYEAERRLHRVPRNQGRCNGLSWGGEGIWLHNPAAPGHETQARRLALLLLRRQRRGDRLDAPQVRPADPHRLPWDRARGRQRSPRPVRLVAVLAPPHRQDPGVMHGAALLAVLDGAENGRRIRVAGQLTVGRDDDAGLLLDDPEISRAHAVPRDRRMADSRFATSGRSTGRWVNGERISSPTRPRRPETS